MPIQTKSTQAREKKLIRSSIFCDSFLCRFISFVFQFCGWISPDGSVLEPHSDKNKARQRGCDFGHSRTAVLGGTTAGRRVRGVTQVVGELGREGRVRVGWSRYKVLIVS